MSTTPTRAGESEVDDETLATLHERLKTIERDGKDAEEWTADLKDRRIRQLQSLVPR
jgi:hypothetical protein